MLVFLGVCLILLLTVSPSESAPAPAPAPFTVEALLAANLLGLAGLKGKKCLRKVIVTKLSFTFIVLLGYLIGNALAGQRRG